MATNFERAQLLILVAVMLGTTPTSAQSQAMSADVQLQAQSQAPAPPNSSSSSSYDDQRGWHVELSPYLWLAGTHGTVGALGRDVSMHATPKDLLSHLDFGLMGTAEARDNRFLLLGDLLWIRLSDSKALPFPRLSATSVDVRVGQLVWTSKIGYRVFNGQSVKADATLRARFWHLGQELSFQPSALGSNISPSQSWADIVIGGRINIPIRQKASITTFGDVGGWNATAKLDYEFGGLFNYKICPKWILAAGYRYLFVDYRNGGSNIQHSNFRCDSRRDLQNQVISHKKIDCHPPAGDPALQCAPKLYEECGR